MQNVVILNKLTGKGTLQQVFYLSEAPYPPITHLLPTLTHCTVYVYTVYLLYSHREGGGGRPNQREG